MMFITRPRSSAPYTQITDDIIDHTSNTSGFSVNMALMTNVHTVLEADIVLTVTEFESRVLEVVIVHIRFELSHVVDKMLYFDTFGSLVFFSTVRFIVLGCLLTTSSSSLGSTYIFSLPTPLVASYIVNLKVMYTCDINIKMMTVKMKDTGDRDTRNSLALRGKAMAKHLSIDTRHVKLYIHLPRHTMK